MDPERYKHLEGLPCVAVRSVNVAVPDWWLRVRVPGRVVGPEGPNCVTRDSPNTLRVCGSGM